jgi:hypothetical protein
VGGELVNFGVNRRYCAVLCRLAGVIIVKSLPRVTPSLSRRMSFIPRADPFPGWGHASRPTVTPPNSDLSQRDQCSVGHLGSEHEQEQINDFFRHWFKMLEDEMAEKGQTILEIMARLDMHDQKIAERLDKAKSGRTRWTRICSSCCSTS